MKNNGPILSAAVAAVFAATSVLAAADKFRNDTTDCSAQRAEWTEFRKNFKPDYSDGARHLLPPEGNRFKTPFPVVKDGKPAAAIVHWGGYDWNAAMGSPVLENAAKELQRHIKLMTGVTVPINPKASETNGLRRIFLGKTAFIKKYAPLGNIGKEAIREDLNALGNTDGFAIRSFGDDIAVYGTLDRGVLNGVYALLENNTDIIWARPNRKHGTVFTPRAELEFVWGEGAFVKYATPVRGMWICVDHPYYAANGCNTFMMGLPWREYDNDNYIRGAHNVTDFVPPAAERPELHGLVNGKRGDYTYQLCFSNPETKRVFAENVLYRMRISEYNQMDGMSISLDDSPNWCECENCRKPMVLKDGTTVAPDDPAFMSTQYFLFMNDVADALAAEFPGKRIFTLAYFQTAEPPKCEVSPNIVITYCPYMRVNDSNPFFCKENEIWLDRARRWHEKLGDRRLPELYGYNILGQSFPRAIGHAQKRDMIAMYPHIRGYNSESSMAVKSDSIGADGVENTTVMQMDWSAIEIWVTMQLYKNPDQDVEQLYKRYCYRAYREAAKPMERFYGILRNEWIRKERFSTIGETGVSLTKIYIVDAGHEDELRACLDEALSVVKHPDAKWLVERVKHRFETYAKEVYDTKRSSAVLPLLNVRNVPDFDDAAWDTATLVDGFHDWTKPENPSKYQAEVRIFHDTVSVYLKFKLFENTSDFPALSENGRVDENAAEIFDGFSHIEIFLEDMQNTDLYRLYRLRCDGAIRDYTAYDSAWNGDRAREFRVRRAPDRWEAILKIPLADVSYDGSGKSVLKCGIVRETYQPKERGGNEYSAWQYCRHHQPQTFGELTLQR